MGETGLKSKLVRFSIQSKILMFLILLVIISIGTGLYFSLDLFYKDKTAYIFESSLTQSEQIGNGIFDYVRSQVSEAEVFAQFARHPDQLSDLKMIMERKKDIYQFTILHRQEDGEWVINQEITKPQISEQRPDVLEAFHSRDNLTAINWDDIRKEGLKIFYHLDYQKKPYVSLVFSGKLDSDILILKISAKPIFEYIKIASAFKTFLMEEQGNFLISQDSNLANPELVNFIKSKAVDKGVFDGKLAGKQYLIGFQKIKKLNLVIVNLVGKDRAFQAARSLIEKSLAIGVLIVSIALALGVLVSRSLTRPIDTLMGATLRIAQGDFISKVKVTTKDEFLVLADSFNFMSEEINNYTNQIKEKIRMEKELAVAHLVQSSFFPHQNVKFGNVSISGFYQSASECGGDWWGAYEIGGKKIVLIGDATGHGVPAALVTATANCCAQLLNDLSTNRPELLQEPGEILKMMNRVIYNLGGKILMTFFIGIIDEDNQTLSYSNASHNSPMIYRYAEHAPTKSDIQVLMEAIGNRLGHEITSEYGTAQVKFAKGDVLILYTDGVTESENPEGKQYGERRFIKSILQMAKTEPQQITAKILEDAYDYYQDVPPNDDVTLVTIKQG